MRHKYLVSLAALALLLFGSSAAFGQNAELRGHVVMESEGKKVGVPNAQIDVYRTDLPGKYNTKTNKRGEFVFAGLPLTGTYTIAVSAPNIAPTFLAKLRAGQGQDFEFVVTAGDGRRLTEAEIKAGASGNAGNASAATGKESAEDKAAREAMAAKVKEVEEQNKKITASNEIVARTFKAGNDAYTAKNYDEAIKQYDEGLAADPAQVALLTNKALALKARGVDRYNAAITSKDDATRNSGMDSAKQDFRAAVDASGKAVELIKAQAAGTDPAAQQQQTANKYAALSVRSDAMRLFVTKVDPSQADAGLTAFQDYIAVETDLAKKSKAQLDAAQMLLDAGAADKAFTEFKKVLDQKPDDPDANLGAGLALFASGDKSKYQDAANYLQHFVDTAPETHKLKADAKAILAELKNTEKVTPQKTEPARRRRP